MKNVPSPPGDLFDIVLVDEAHHSAAETWNDLMNAFPFAYRILFTATPFRRDNREIKAKPVYYYPLARAYDEKTFGEVTYFPVEANGDPDTAISRQVQMIWDRDKALVGHAANNW